MTEKLVIISFFQTVFLLFTLQELLANPLHTQQNNNTSHNIKVSDYPRLDDSKKIRNVLINVTINLRNISEDINNLSIVVEDQTRQLRNWAFEEISNITNSNISKGKFLLFVESIRRLEMNVKELSLELSKEPNINEVVGKSTSVQNYLNHLQKNLDENFRHAYQLLSEYFFENNIIDKYDNLTIQKSNIDMKIEEEVQKKLVEDCIHAVRNDNFLKAAFFIDIIKDLNKFEYIIKRLDIEESFKLGNEIRNIPKSFKLYKTIYHVLVEGKQGTVDEFDIIKLIRNIKEGIIDQTNTPTFIKKEAIEFNKKLGRTLRDLVFMKVEKLSFPECDEIDISFIEEIIIADYRLAAEIFYNAYAKYWDRDGLNCLFRYVYAGINFNQSNAFKFALFLKYFIDSCRNDNTICDTFTSLIDELLPSVRTVVFANRVCISQPRVSKLLRLRGVPYYTERYSTYIHGNSNYREEDFWKLTHLENNVFIVENIGMADTYLDTDLYNADKSGIHVVYGWQKPPNHGTWKFELTENLEFFYIKNLARNEFLYITDDVNNFAYTKYMMYEGKEDFEWKISNCSDVKLSIQ